MFTNYYKLIFRNLKTGKYSISIQNFHESHSTFEPFQTFCSVQFGGLHLRNYDGDLCEIDTIFLVSVLLHRDEHGLGFKSCSILVFRWIWIRFSNCYFT